jgi:hypothetical protein
MLQVNYLLSPRLLSVMLAVAFVFATLSIPAEARSPRGWANHHLGKIKDDIKNGKEGLKKAKEGGERLKLAHQESKAGFVKLANLEVQLKQAAKNIQSLQKQQKAMAVQIAALPVGTPGRSQLKRNMKSAQARTNNIANVVRVTRKNLTKLKPKLVKMADEIKDASETFDKNKGTLKKIKKGLNDAGDVVSTMKKAAKYLPNAPNISQLK